MGLNGVAVSIMEKDITASPPVSTKDGADARTYSKPSKVAARLGISKNTVFRWIKHGRLTRHKIGDVTLVANDEVDHLMSQARIEKVA
jgi:excisionase family DNA binding protein